MRIWIVSFGILFALVEFYQWAKGFISPLPVYVLGGAFLAFASNYESKESRFKFPQSIVLFNKQKTASFEEQKSIALHLENGAESEQTQSLPRSEASERLSEPK